LVEKRRDSAEATERLRGKERERLATASGPKESDRTKKNGEAVGGGKVYSRMERESKVTKSRSQKRGKVLSPRTVHIQNWLCD